MDNFLVIEATIALFSISLVLWDIMAKKLAKREKSRTAVKLVSSLLTNYKLSAMAACGFTRLSATFCCGKSCISVKPAL